MKAVPYLRRVKSVQGIAVSIESEQIRQNCNSSQRFFNQGLNTLLMRRKANLAAQCRQPFPKTG
jgi:hypothetical protein